MFFTASRSKRAIVAIGFAGLISAFVSSNASAGPIGGDMFADAAPINGAGTTFGLGGSGRIGSGLIQPIASARDGATPTFVDYELKKKAGTDRAFVIAAPINGAGTTFGLGGSGRIGSGLTQPIASARDAATATFVDYELKKKAGTDRAFAALAVPGA